MVIFLADMAFCMSNFDDFAVTKYHENLLRDSSLSLLSTVKFFSYLEIKMILKIRNETFLRITQYLLPKKWMQSLMS